MKSGGDIYAEMNRRTVPYAANLELTAACNLDCIHCYHVRASGGELGTEEMCALLDELAAAGTMELTLTGGEPLARKDFSVILRHAVEHSGFSIKIFSNLTLLDEGIADIVAEVGINRVETTLLGPDAALHDRIAGRAGAFESLMKGIRMLRERSVTVSVKTVLLRENVRRLDDMTCLAGELGVPFRWDDGVFVESDGGRGPLAHRISEREARRIRNSSGASPEKTVHHSCNAGKSIMSIGPDGSVYPCGAFPVAAGSIRDAPFAAIWKESPLLKLARTFRDADYRVCEGCRYEFRCGGCMAMGWGLAGGRIDHCRFVRKHLGSFR